MYPYWLINYTKCNLLMQGVNNGGKWVWSGGEGIWEISAPFFRKFKTDLKNKV